MTKRQRRRLMTLTRPFERIGPLIRWLLAGVAVSLGFFGISGAFAVGQAKDSLLGVMLLLFGYGFVLSARATLMLILEESRARGVVRLLEQSDVSSVLGKMRGKRGLFLAAVRGMYQQARVSHASVSVEARVGLLQSRMGEAVGRVYDLAELLTGIGLIGTMLGLMAMMTSLTLTLQGAHGQGGGALLALLFGPQGPMAGLGTAFVTTLAGSVMGGVFLHTLARSIERSIDRFVAHTEELLTDYVLPALRGDGENRGGATNA